jgi:hypothetical protein
VVLYAETKWNHAPYDDPARTSARLRAWVHERTFPDMNTPEAEIHLQDDDGVLADYTIGRQFVYAGFAWSKAVAAAGEAERLAKLHGVGFFDVSSNGEEVWLPVNGTLELAHQKKQRLLNDYGKGSVVAKPVTLMHSTSNEQPLPGSGPMLRGQLFRFETKPAKAA